MTSPFDGRGPRAGPKEIATIHERTSEVDSVLSANPVAPSSARTILDQLRRARARLLPSCIARTLAIGIVRPSSIRSWLSR
jgi:hypothetical protein